MAWSTCRAELGDRILGLSIHSEEFPTEGLLLRPYSKPTGNSEQQLKYRLVGSIGMTLVAVNQPDDDYGCCLSMDHILGDWWRRSDRILDDWWRPSQVQELVIRLV